MRSVLLALHAILGFALLGLFLLVLFRTLSFLGLAFFFLLGCLGLAFFLPLGFFSLAFFFPLGFFSLALLIALGFLGLALFGTFGFFGLAFFFSLGFFGLALVFPLGLLGLALLFSLGFFRATRFGLLLHLQTEYLLLEIVLCFDAALIRHFLLLGRRSMRRICRSLGRGWLRRRGRRLRRLFQVAKINFCLRFGIHNPQRLALLWLEHACTSTHGKVAARRRRSCGRLWVKATVHGTRRSVWRCVG